MLNQHGRVNKIGFNNFLCGQMLLEFLNLLSNISWLILDSKIYYKLWIHPKHLISQKNIFGEFQMAMKVLILKYFFELYGVSWELSYGFQEVSHMCMVFQSNMCMHWAIVNPIHTQDPPSKGDGNDSG